MQWKTEFGHSTKKPANVSVVVPPNSDFEPWIRVDFRGVDISLSFAEARQLAADLSLAISANPRQETEK